MIDNKSVLAWMIMVQGRQVVTGMIMRKLVNAYMYHRDSMT